MNKTILVTYASKNGATAKIAKKWVKPDPGWYSNDISRGQNRDDFRDWDAITRWAKSISTTLTEM